MQCEGVVTFLFHDMVVAMTTPAALYTWPVSFTVMTQQGSDSNNSPCIQVKPQTVSNLLWAYATLGWAPTHLLTSLAVETLRQLPYFKPQELANTLWSYATLGYTPMPEWLAQMGVACEGQVGGCKPQELSSLVWALATLRFHPGPACLATAIETASR